MYIFRCVSNEFLTSEDKGIMLKQFKRFRASDVDTSLGLVFILFCIGTVVGTVIGCVFSSPVLNVELSSYIDSSVISDSFLSSLYNAFFFILLVLLFGTSFLGVFLIPSAVLIKAYSMSCSIAVMYHSFGTDGMLCALFSIGISSLLIIPCFLVIALDSLFSSRQLYSIRFYSASYGRGGTDFLRHMMIAVPVTLMTAAYEYFLLPVILARI